MIRIALISTPWPLFNRPSIQLGALKAFVEQKFPQAEVDVYHVYLTVAETLGYGLYKQISERTWLSESPYAALLYPDREELITRFWRRQTTGLPLLKDSDFKEILYHLKTASDRFINGIEWGDYDLIGFSICFEQLTSSLYFIHHIMQKAPSIKIVVGGSACAGQMGRTLLSVFPEIDFVVSGEGEVPLIHLIKWLTRSGGEGKPTPIPGLLLPNGDSDAEIDGFSQLTPLDQLPLPDFSDYFRQLRALKPEKGFLPKIPMEISRGCWWRKHSDLQEHKGCAFCNLNLQWKGYRAKSPDRVVKELSILSEKYQILSVSFMDNLLPAKDLKGLFERVAGLRKDFRLFAEIRATTTKEELSAMGDAGVCEVQVGIEALSSRLLKKMNKGTTAIENLEIMKNCESKGLPNLTGNLILNFPGSDQLDVEETLHALEFALPFRPLKGVPFWLGYGSPVWEKPNMFELRSVHNHPFYGYLFPPEIFKSLAFIIQGYYGGLKHQQRLWRPVRQKMKEWKEGYLKRHEDPGSDPILSFQDGGHFLIIRQRRYGKDDMVHRLKDTSRKIFLFCQKIRSMQEIFGRFPGFGEEKVRPFLRMMVDKRLMFQEADRYLSLAVPIKEWRYHP